jgi:hypothetical protein
MPVRPPQAQGEQRSTRRRRTTHTGVVTDRPAWQANRVVEGRDHHRSAHWRHLCRRGEAGTGGGKRVSTTEYTRGERGRGPVGRKQPLPPGQPGPADPPRAESTAAQGRSAWGTSGSASRVDGFAPSRAITVIRRPQHHQREEGGGREGRGG